MTEDLKSGNGADETTPSSYTRAQRVTGLGYQLALAFLTVALLIHRTEPDRLTTDGPLLLLFLLISVVCDELGFSLGSGVTSDLSGLFRSAAALSLGFNGVWVFALSYLFHWLFSEFRREYETMPTPSRLVSHLFNLSTNTLPPWLGLFVYHDLMKGELPLADLGTNVAPALAFVLVQWVTVPASLFPLLLIAERGMSGAAQWFKSILTGLILSFHVPTLFALAVAVILNRLGLGFFVFVTAGLLGVSLMAQRLAHSLAAERRRVEELTALNALNDDIIHNPPGGETTGELLVRHAPRFMPDADFELCLLDAKRSENRQVVVVWRDGAPQPTADAPLTPLWAWLREQRRPLLVADLAQEAPPFAWDDQGDGPRPGSLLLVPLLATDPASPETERCFGGLRLSHARRRALTTEALPSVTALANQLAAAMENARLHQVALARERLERELVLARGIQTSFLPASVPQIAGWAFAASLEPARHVSGDFYDFIPLPGGCWGVLIADVADKGMPAALYMALSRTLIRAHAPEHADDPAACLLAANDQILTDTQADSFVTVFYGIIHPATGEMQFTNAGHNPPYLCRQSGVAADAAPTPLRTAGMPLGILPGVELGNGCVHLMPGDYVVLYTDGVTEAQDQVHNEFGTDRLLAEITRRDGDSVQMVHRRVHKAVGKFVGDAPQFDDLTLMVMSREAQT